MHLDGELGELPVFRSTPLVFAYPFSFFFNFPPK